MTTVVAMSGLWLLASPAPVVGRLLAGRKDEWIMTDRSSERSIATRASRVWAAPGVIRRGSGEGERCEGRAARVRF
jgi:hypothetical protein